MAYAEALAEALCLFQYPSQLGPVDQIAKHCLLMSLTQAHSVPIPWPWPLPSEPAHDQVCTCTVHSGFYLAAAI